MEKLFNFFKHDVVVFLIGLTTAIIALDLLTKEHFVLGGVLVLLGMFVCCLPIADA